MLENYLLNLWITNKIVKIAKPDQIRNCNEELSSFSLISSNCPSIVPSFDFCLSIISAYIVP